MKIDLGSGELCLTDNQPVRLIQAKGILIRCLAGNIWITVQNVPGDTHLTAGQSYLIPANGLALVESIGSGRMKIIRETGKRRLLVFQFAHRYLRAALGIIHPASSKPIA